MGWRFFFNFFFLIIRIDWIEKFLVQNLLFYWNFDFFRLTYISTRVNLICYQNFSFTYNHQLWGSFAFFQQNFILMIDLFIHNTEYFQLTLSCIGLNQRNYWKQFVNVLGFLKLTFLFQIFFNFWNDDQIIYLVQSLKFTSMLDQFTFFDQPSFIWKSSFCANKQTFLINIHIFICSQYKNFHSLNCINLLSFPSSCIRFGAQILKELFPMNI